MLEPKVLFLDEPFSALDYEMTLLMRDQLQRILGESKTTMLFVSDAIRLPTSTGFNRNRQRGEKLIGSKTLDQLICVPEDPGCSS